MTCRYVFQPNRQASPVGDVVIARGSRRDVAANPRQRAAVRGDERVEAGARSASRTDERPILGLRRRRGGSTTARRSPPPRREQCRSAERRRARGSPACAERGLRIRPDARGAELLRQVGRDHARDLALQRARPAVELLDGHVVGGDLHHDLRLVDGLGHARPGRPRCGGPPPDAVAAGAGAALSV